MSAAAASELLTSARVVTSNGVFAPGWVAIERGEIAGVGEGRPAGFTRDLGDAVLVPGFVDSHVHGGGGHTDADYETTKRAIDAGATVATHLFNAMPPLLHREPGPVLALLEDERVTLELVADGEYRLGSLDVDVEAGVARLRRDGAIAGSTATISSCSTGCSPFAR